MDYRIIFLMVIAYLLGSIPFGVLVTKAKGIDLKSAGSRNIGATNVLRTAGKLPALITLLGDFLKGAVALLLCSAVLEGELWEAITGISVVLGHIYPIFLSFKGGKGVATGFGVLAVYSPLELVIILIIWLATALWTRYSSLAAILSYGALPIVSLLLNATWIKLTFVIIITYLIILNHRDNIKRLLKGRESKIGEMR